MSDQIIVCPKCNYKIELSEALTSQLQEKIRKEFEVQLKKKEKLISQKEQQLIEKEKDFDKQFSQKIKAEKEKIEKELNKKLQKQIETDLSYLQDEIKEKDKKIKESRKKELELIKQQKELEENKKSFELDFERKLIQERQKLEKEIKTKTDKKYTIEIEKLQLEIKEKEKIVSKNKKIEEDFKKLKDKFDLQHEELEKDFELKIKDLKKKIEVDVKQKAEENLSIELKDMQMQLKEKDEKVAIAEKKELELLKQKRELEEKKKSFELEMTRKLDEERKIVEEAVANRISEEYRFKMAENERQITGMIKQIEELKRKAEQGSQQMQGEVLELELEDMLKNAFPRDIIEPISKGAKGADVVQKVYDNFGRDCGTIIWETKRTKNWSDNWIDKLKEDQRETKAELAVLMTISMPKNVNNFGFINGVWVTNLDCTVALATALRLNLIELNSIKLASIGKNEKMEILYNYLSGNEFKQKIEAIVEAFTTMKQELYTEKKAITKLWAKREKQIDRVFNNTIKMYGDMEGIIGNAMPQIENLEIKALTSDLSDEIE